MTLDFDAAFGASLKNWGNQQGRPPTQISAGGADRRLRGKRGSTLRPNSNAQPALLVSLSGDVCDAVPQDAPPQLALPRSQRIALEDLATLASPPIQEPPNGHMVLQLGHEVQRPLRVKGKKCGQPEQLSEAQISRVLANIDLHSAAPVRDRTMFLLTVRAGLRPCEVAGLRIRTLHTASGELLDHILVMPGTAKRGRQRTVPLHPQLRGELLTFPKAYPGAERIAFRVMRGGRFSYQNAHAVGAWFAQLYARLGLVGYSAMSGRHTFADGLYRLGAPLSEIQKLMGHARLATTRIYLRPRDVSPEQINYLGSFD